jgi:membrane protease YdiL (CAAX protease family)
MDFDFKKPRHLLALLFLLSTFIGIIILPILSFFGVLPSTQEIIIPDSLFFEIFFLVFQLILVLLLLIIVPFLWYMLVNNCNLSKILNNLKLKFENVDIAFLWGVVVAILIFIVFFVIELILIYILGVNVEDLGNIQDIERWFSPVSMFILISFQPIAEEVFFRGFLLNKIDTVAGKNIAIYSTALLFGLAHMSYGKIFPVLFPMIMGIFLAYIVYRTKNLYAAIFAHIFFNIASFALYFLSESLK